MTTTDTKPVALPKAPAKFKVDVIYCSPDGPIRQVVDCTEGTTVSEALMRARFHERFRSLDLERSIVGVFGNIVKLATPLKPGDRVEVYRPITCDPETVPRRDRPSGSNEKGE